MATCPRCHEFLGPGHRCTNLWQLRLRRAAASLVAMTIGMAAGLIAVYAVRDAPPLELLLVGALGGMVLGQAIWKASRS